MMKSTEPYSDKHNYLILLPNSIIDREIINLVNQYADDMPQDNDESQIRE